MLTYTQSYTKFQTISGSTNATDLVQAKQDINIGYKRFNAAIARYFTRKQAFTNLVADQQYYQIPVDAIRVSSVTINLSGSTLQFPLTQIRNEDEWRSMNIFPYSSSYIKYYFVYGNDQIGLFPIPSTAVTNGLRYVYQPQDVDLTKDDYSTGTVAVSNGGVTVTGTNTAWTNALVGGMYFQVTNGTDGNWYEILSVNSTTQITLKTPYVGSTVSGVSYNIGQMFIFPGEYDDVPIDYALYRFWESRDNPVRAKYHKNNYQEAVADAIQKYASSSLSNVITDEGPMTNAWFWPPLPGA